MDPRNSNSGCFREHLKIGTNDDISGKVAIFSGKLATLPFGKKNFLVFFQVVFAG